VPNSGKELVELMLREDPIDRIDAAEVIVHKFY